MTSKTPAVTLDSLRADLDKQYAPYVVDGFVLRNLMRVEREKREAVLSALEVIQAQSKEEEDDQSPEDLARMEDALYTVLSALPTGGKGDALVKALDGDILLALEIITRWTEATQPGEAQPSPA